MNQILDYAKNIGADARIMDWLKTTFKNYSEKNPVPTEEIEHILDYFVSESPKISKMSYEEAKNNTEKWNKTLQKKGEHIKETPEDIEIILDFKDGFKMVKLIGKNAFKREGFLMRHCAGSYFDKTDELYSLRDEDNLPHATLSKSSQQIKGKGNGDIHPKYINYVVQFLEYLKIPVRDEEMKHLGYLNFDKVKTDLHPDTKFFRKIYLPKNEKLIDKKGNEYMSLDLLDIKPLIEDDETNLLKVNFDIDALCKLSFEWISRKIKSRPSSQQSQSGDYSQQSQSGDYSKQEMLGKYSVAVNAAHNGKVKGKIGCWFALTEWSEDKDRIWKPLSVQSFKIDGKKIKEDVWYTLKSGKLIEVKENE